MTFMTFLVDPLRMASWPMIGVVMQEHCCILMCARAQWLGNISQLNNVGKARDVYDEERIIGVYVPACVNIYSLELEPGLNGQLLIDTKLWEGEKLPNANESICDSIKLSEFSSALPNCHIISSSCQLTFNPATEE